MNIDENKYIELYSQARLNSYSSIQEHEQNFQILDKIASKLSRIEIIIRNRIDRKMCEFNKNWLFHLQDDIYLDTSDEAKDHNTLISKQTFNFWVKVVEHYKIHNCAFEEDFLDISFKNTTTKIKKG
ncbi:hypothetical protein [Campylobacter devanensis]|uniref:hypothetical protein n=1 Tax=Campylobacter devanensis TaxID=3161138 RepID=UPI000A34C2D1|nr:hypothetical protein [Campylobacter sp. P0227]